MKVRYRALALADLDHIFSYLNDRNPIAAEDVTKAIYAAIEFIGEHPLGAPPTSDPTIHIKVVRKYGYKKIHLRRIAICQICEQNSFTN